MTNKSSSTIENIKDKLQIILDKKFSSDSRIRRKIDVYHDRINFCCPYCSDSRTDIRKKRGNLYLDSLRYFCFNCGCSVGINKFLSDFNEELSIEDKVQVHEIQQNAKKFERRTSTQSSMAFTLLEKLAIPKQIFFKAYSITSPYKNEFASNYLKSRKIEIKDWKYFAINEHTKELFILNITPEDRVIGYQIRQLDPNSKKARYLSRTISKIYDETFHKDLMSITERILKKDELGEKYINEEDGMENIMANLDRMSGFFNVMNINMSRPLTIVEGPIDSLGIDNCIALQGATKTYDFFDKVENVRFLFDNDKVGKEMAIKKLKDHKTVFLWGNYLNMIKTNSKIKDINDLQKAGLLYKDKLEECFSNDELDVVAI